MLISEKENDLIDAAVKKSKKSKSVVKGYWEEGLAAADRVGASNPFAWATTFLYNKLGIKADKEENYKNMSYAKIAEEFMKSEYDDIDEFLENIDEVQTSGDIQKKSPEGSPKKPVKDLKVSGEDEKKKKKDDEEDEKEEDDPKEEKDDDEKIKDVDESIIDKETYGSFTLTKYKPEDYYDILWMLNKLKYGDPKEYRKLYAKLKKKLGKSGLDEIFFMFGDPADPKYGKIDGVRDKWLNFLDSQEFKNLMKPGAYE